MFSEKATKNDEIFTVDLTLCSKCQIDFVIFCGLLRKHELLLCYLKCAYIYYKESWHYEKVHKNPKAPSEMIPTHYDSSDPKSGNETSGGLTPA